jgi:recombination protein RecA
MAMRLIDSYLTRFKDKEALFVDFEQTFDSKWASNFITKQNLERLYVTQPDYGELGIDVLVEACKEPTLGFVVIDSLAMIITTKEADSDASSSLPGILARTVNSMFRRLLPIVSQAKRQGRPLTFLLLNQIRLKLGASTGFGTPVSKPAGKMQDAIISLDVRFYTKEYKKKGELPVSVVHTFTVEKNKVGGQPKRSGQFTVTLVPHDGLEIGDVDEVNTILAYARKVGLIQRDGKGWDFLKKKFKTLAEIQDLLRDREVARKVGFKIVTMVSEHPEILLKGEE